MAETNLPEPIAPAPPAAPVMDVVTPPPLAGSPAQSPLPPARPPKPPAAANVPIANPVKPQTPPKQGVTAAITATVIIVLGLAVLAVFAYIKQK